MNSLPSFLPEMLNLDGEWESILEKLGRIPDYERAKRLPWTKPTIENHSNPVIKSWDYGEGNGRIRIYLWLENYDYVVILERNRGRRKHLLILITAFYVEEYKKKDLQRRYEKRIA